MNTFNGKSCTIHYNSDLSGEVVIELAPKGDPARDISPVTEINGSDIKEFMRHYAISNNEILQKILSGYKKLTAYYTYPTRGAGEQIFETNNWNGGSYDEPLKNVINLCVQLGAAVAGCRLDNKTAVRVEVDGLDFPVYFRRFDGMYCISTDLSRRSGQEIEINWNIEY